jgi:hypothetical protein
MTARRQMQIGDFFQSTGGASSSRVREMSAEASDMDGYESSSNTEFDSGCEGLLCTTSALIQMKR